MDLVSFIKSDRFLFKLIGLIFELTCVKYNSIFDLNSFFQIISNDCMKLLGILA